MVNLPLTILVADYQMQASGGMAPRALLREHDHGDAFGTGSR